MLSSQDRKLFRDDRAKEEEKNGLISIKVFHNDDSKENYILLTAVKNIFQKQLPKMPKEYIARLVYDRNHKSLAIVKNNDQAIGAITYRNFPGRGFIEIVFCAINSNEQVRGYGSYLMNHMKEQAKKEGALNFLTYADNYAVGYFKKQGFTKEITLDKSLWQSFIKDYDGGTLMQCTLLPKINYLNVYQILHEQKSALMVKVQEKCKSKLVYPGLLLTKLDNYLDIPGLREAGWTEEMSRIMSIPRKNKLHDFLKNSITELQSHGSAWPFLEPVNVTEVPDYLDVIKNPMDLATMEKKVEREEYKSLDEFASDFLLITSNCKIYNAETTQYYKCALTLEEFFNQKIRMKYLIL